jgi:inward rectifier potassium channel
MTEGARLRIGSREVIKKGLSRFDMRDPYYVAVALSWPQFVVALFVAYLLVNLMFAGLYWLVPGSVVGARPYSLQDVFLFSIETLSTVGYGDMHPAAPYGYWVVAIEIVCGLAFTAILTGLTFVRFSRPRARLLFASNPVVAMHNDKPTLMLRVGNGRAGVLLDAAAKLNVVFALKTADGKLLRRVRELRLKRTHLPVFAFTWTLVHVLDEGSPLCGFDAARAIAARVSIFVVLQARDPKLGTLVDGFRDYAPEDICFGMRYADAVTAIDDGSVVADMTQISALRPDLCEHWKGNWTEGEEVWE